ncbi:MAG: alpha-galactosidase, partial [Rectinema sp.]|nr:alpha-galactosidase [Rectinema sp.]
VFQIDDGWQQRVGDWEADTKKFPAGMRAMAERIRAKGLVPGIWLAPFLVMPDSCTAREHKGWILRNAEGEPVRAGWNPNWGGDVWCLDLSLPEVRDYLHGLFDQVVNQWGYRYLKLDFLYAGMMRGAFAGDRGAAWEHYVRSLRRILEHERAIDGTPVAFLSCGAPIEITAPFMPLMRSGADTREHWEWWQLKLIGHQGRPSAAMNMRDSIGRALLNRTLLWCDPDVVFCRTARTSLADTEKFLVGMVAWMFGSQIMISDDPAAFGQDQTEDAQRSANTSRGGGISEAEFTAQLVDWYRRIGSREFSIERAYARLKDVFYFQSKDGSVRGAINLSDREVAIPLPESGQREAGPDAHYPIRGYPVPAHSMLIFGV